MSNENENENKNENKLQNGKEQLSIISTQRVNKKEQTEEGILKPTVAQEEQQRKRSPVDKNMRKRIIFLCTVPQARIQRTLLR